MRARNRRKILRIVGVAASVTLLLFAVIVIIVLKSLPTMGDLQGRYFSSRLRPPVTTNQPIAMQLRSQTQDTVSATTQPATLTAPQIPVSTSPAPAPTPASLADYAVERFVERGERTLRVCEELLLPQNAPPVDTGSFGRAVENEITGNRRNPYAEAAFAPLGALLQLPSVGAVATQIRDAQLAGDPSLIQQAQFYSNVAFAAAEMYRQKPLIDLVSQHSYHLSVLAKLASLAPSAINQPEFADLCSVSEARALEPMSSSLFAIDEEKAQIMNLIGALGLTPQQVGFDPGLDATTSIDITPQAVTLRSPWMNQIYGSGLQIAAPTQQAQTR